MGTKPTNDSVQGKCRLAELIQYSSPALQVRPHRAALRQVTDAAVVDLDADACARHDQPSIRVSMISV